MHLNEKNENVGKPLCHDLGDEVQSKDVNVNGEMLEKKFNDIFTCYPWRKGKTSSKENFKLGKLPHFKDGKEYKEYLRRRGYID